MKDWEQAMNYQVEINELVTNSLFNLSSTLKYKVYLTEFVDNRVSYFLHSVSTV